VDINSGDDNPSQPGEKPAFEIDGNLRTLRLAGALQLPPLYTAGEEGESEGKPYENVSAALRLNNRVTPAQNDPEAKVFGSRGWASTLLLNQGFKVGDADSLSVVIQETQQGSFAEIFFQPGRAGSNNPVLIVNCAEDGKILGYYYHEDGTNLEAGYYSLLTPVQALRSVQRQVIYSSSQPSLDFREVAFTFETFTIVQNGVQENVTLPAYCFTGEELQTGSEVKIILPAISW
jgi:hypothetical protein